MWSGCVRARRSNMKLSVIMPAFNEAKTIAPALALVMAADIGAWKREVIVVDDGSTDATSGILGRLRGVQYDFTLLRHSRNQGKSAAIATALTHTTGDAVIIQDADLEYDPTDWGALLALFEAGHPVVYGSRNLGAGQQGYAAYAAGAWALTRLCNALYGSKLTDLYTCSKLIRTDILREAGIASKGFDFCPEITAKILLAGHSITEAPINYYPRSFAAGKKIRPWDGVRGAWTLMSLRLKKW